MTKKTIRVSEEHKEILNLRNYQSLDRVIDEAIQQLFLFNVDRPLSRSFYHQIRREFKHEFSLDVTPKLADWFVRRLFNWVEEQGNMRTKRDLLKKLGLAYYQIAKPWMPLFAAYVSAALSISKEYKAKEAWIISRDATPLFLIALGVKDKIKWDGKIRLVECNRDMFGIPAVFDAKGKPVNGKTTPFGKPAQEIRNLPVYLYLRKLRGTPQKRIAWIETGYHGTLIKKIADLGLLGDMLFFFLSSSNPNILGYANILVIYEILRKGGIPDDFTYILGDQVESLPKFYKNVQILRKGKGFELIAEPVAPIYKFCAMVSYWTLFNKSLGIDPTKVDSLSEIKKLYGLSLKVKNNSEKLPLVLPECIPGWKDGLTFLQKRFDLGPLQPMFDWWGP